MCSNGIIENYVSIKKLLEQKGVKIRSETDTEVLAHLVYCVRMENPTMPLEEVVRLALQPVEGAYGVVFIFAEQPNLIIAGKGVDTFTALDLRFCYLMLSSFVFYLHSLFSFTFQLAMVVLCSLE